jgi:DHA1 family inner membrane transport protein
MGMGLAAGSMGLMMLGLQPLVLGALATEHRLTEDQIGLAATAEWLALGLTTGLLASLLTPARLKSINAAACLVLAGANIGGMYASGLGFVASRFCAGMAGGVLVWIAIALITRAARPDRFSGIFLVGQTLAQAGLAAILPATLMLRYGANGGLASLAALGVLCIGLSAWLPSRLAALPAPAEGHGALPLPGLVGLAAVFFTMAGVVGFWIFAEQLGTGAHIGATITGYAVAGALAAQVAGGSAATWLSGKLPTVPTLALAGAVNIGVALALSGGAFPAAVYVTAIVLFGFMWLFAMPFQTRLLIDADPSRRAAMLLSAAQLLGSSAGPIVTSQFATSTSLAGAMRADTGLFAAGIVLVISLYRRA